jgi:hypothetical protein
VCTVTPVSDSEEAGNECPGQGVKEEDAAGVYGCTGKLRANSQGRSGQDREEDAASAYGYTGTPVHYEQTVRTMSKAFIRVTATPKSTSKAPILLTRPPEDTQEAAAEVACGLAWRCCHDDGATPPGGENPGTGESLVPSDTRGSV